MFDPKTWVFYFTKLTPVDCPVLPDFTGSHIWSHVPISSPKPGHTQLSQGCWWISCLVSSPLAPLLPVSGMSFQRCDAVGGGELGSGTRQTRLWIPASSVICFGDLGLTHFTSLSVFPHVKGGNWDSTCIKKDKEEISFLINLKAYATYKNFLGLPWWSSG